MTDSTASLPAGEAERWGVVVVPLQVVVGGERHLEGRDLPPAELTAALFFAFAPDSVTNRMMSMFDLRDPSNRDRLAMARTGTAMVRDFPLTGVGPAMVPRLYAQYRDPDAVQATNPHLHNVPLQIAAE